MRKAKVQHLFALVNRLLFASGESTGRRSISRRRLHLMRLEDRVVPSAYSLTAWADGYATDTNGDGTFATLNTTSTLVQMQLYPPANNLHEERGLVQFNLSAVPQGTTITSARILGNVPEYTYQNSDPVLINFFDYAASGTISASDATNVSQQAGTLSNVTLGQFSQDLNTPVIQTLVNQGQNFIGFTMTVGSGTGVDVDSINNSANSPQVLTLQINYDQNQVPVAQNDNYSVNGNSTLNVAAPGFMANDSDPDGDSLKAVLVAMPSHSSSFSFSINGAFTYTPANNYVGSDSFTYKLWDGFAYSNVATVNITVNGTDTPPTARNDAYTTPTNTALTVPAPGVLANDSAANGGALTAVLATNPAHGSVALHSDGSFVYTPASGYHGVDSFTYEANDGTLNSSPATVTITVDDPPVASNDSYSVNENTSLTQGTPGVLGNDSDPDGDALTATLVTNPTHGSVVLNSNGSFNYVPFNDFYGSDSFTYKASDGLLFSNAATVTVTVNHVNQPPVANQDNYVATENTALTVAASGILGNDTDPDNDPLTAVLVTQPVNGLVTLNADGSFTYMPNANFSGTDRFYYQASDGQLLSGQTPVVITVQHVNIAPVANADAYSLNENTSLTTAPASAGVTSLVMVSQPGDWIGQGQSYDDTPSMGTFTASRNGDHGITIMYQSSTNIGDWWTVSFAAPYNQVLSPGAYTNANRYPFQDLSQPGMEISGQARGSDQVYGQFTVTQALYDASGDVVSFDATFVQHSESPTAPALTGEIKYNAFTPASGVLANDTDADSNALTATLVSGPAHGVLTLNSDGSFLYTPNAYFNGTDSFMYQASDGALSSNVATVQLQVNAVPPTLTLSGASSVNEGATYTLGLSGSDPYDGPINSWQINWGDGVIQTVSGNPTTVTHVYAETPTSDTISATATDANGTYSAGNTIAVTVLDPPPTSGVTGPADGVRGQDRTFTVTASDTPADQGNFSFHLVWGDGTTTDTSGPSGLVVDHTWTASGSYTIQVTATNLENEVSSPATLTVGIVAAEMQGTTLVVGGTTGKDTITVQPTDTAGDVSVITNGQSQGTFHPSKVIAYGQAGDDSIQLNAARIGHSTVSLNVAVELFGGDGNDNLTAVGNVGTAILSGGAGNDTLTAGSGRSILIGGTGADTLQGGGADDILIGGTTSWDNNLAALDALIAEWKRTDLSYSARINHLDGASTGGLNAGYYLSATTVFDDAAIDQLTGNGGTDWFFAHTTGAFADKITDQKKGEIVTVI